MSSSVVGAAEVEAARQHYNTWPDGRGSVSAATQCRCLAETGTSSGAAGDARPAYQHRCQCCPAADCMHACRDPGRHHLKLGLPGPPPPQQPAGACCCHQPRSAPSASVLRLDALPIGYDRRTRQLRLRPAVMSEPEPPPLLAAPPDSKPGEEERDSGVGESPSSTLQQDAAAPRPLRRADGSLSSSSSLSTEPGLLWDRPRAGSEVGSSRDLSAAAAAAHKAAKKRGISGLFSR